ncbi:pyridoxal-phosphate dependent enzyme [Yinghuangia seranimata]|uniref:pyridoxal-phosphate dependent enzyme n=1 Tax=Yinghuangia seranimata TaxID=408067 RepID=UPI00248B5442|nr:pyridoxal-phosphate dependent enzyme [Yinghuangia seranimata]MDI2130927.1 pyridoxal-phosphate dependent enzyme [Yinghuangia seranimata]
MRTLTSDMVAAAAARIDGVVRPVTVVPSDAPAFAGARVFLALEFLQYMGSFKARGAANFTEALVEAGTMPAAGVAVATGGNADLAYAWAAARRGVPVTVFVADDAAPAKVARLRELGADVRPSGGGLADVQSAARRFAEHTGAVEAHAPDDLLAPAGAGTLLAEIAAAVPGLDTVVVAVGAGGMFSGVTAAAHARGVRVVAAEPVGCQALFAALAAGGVVDVPADSVAADSLGAPRVSAEALAWARHADVRSVVVPDEAIVHARRHLWDHHRIAVEHGSSAPVAALTTGAYVPAPDERVAVVLCGANTDPGDLAD